MSEVFEFAEDLARRAGVLIAQARADRALDLSYKEGIELLTSADLQADQLIRSEIEKTFPDHYILSEESSPHLTDSAQLRGPLWVIDPIDGTVNYAYNQQQVAVSIAFAEGGQVQVGVVHCPFVGETFTARRGAGAYLNGQPIRASECSELSRALIGTGFPYAAEGRVALVDRLRRVLGYCRDIRRVGSAAIDLCWVAMGRLDGFYESLKPWDLAAAALIAREAGARVGHLHPVEGELPEELDGRDLVAAAPGIYEQLVALLRK
ncbi:MAG: inositol monophosphatase family protein [Gemmatimonadota bacterium]|nr:inositol monophosphatase family protein [Gemmatimonadota bacterium]